MKASEAWPKKIYDKTVTMVKSKTFDKLSIRIDGPYGSSSDKILESKNTIIVAAGTGVSKFASILQDISIRSKNIKTDPSVKNLYFIWLSDNAFYIEWFKKLLYELERDFELNYFDFHIYFLDRAASQLPKNMLYVSKDIFKSDFDINLLDNVKNKSSSGHPNWDLELERIRTRFNDGDISLFYSGPKNLQKDLKLSCNNHGIKFIDDI